MLNRLRCNPVNQKVCAGCQSETGVCKKRVLMYNNHPTWLVSCIFQISLGSSAQLIVPKTKLNKHAFSVTAPRVWNELPITLKTSETIATFRKKLKTFILKLQLHHKSSVVPRSDNDFCASLFMIFLNDSVLLRL